MQSSYPSVTVQNPDTPDERINVGSAFSYHIYCAEDVAVVVAGLQVLGDVRKRAQVLWVLGRTRDVTDFMFCDDVLHKWERKLEIKTGNKAEPHKVKLGRACAISPNVTMNGSAAG